jgi:hypothetical protein
MTILAWLLLFTSVYELLPMSANSDAIADRYAGPLWLCRIIKLNRIMRSFCAEGNCILREW